MKVERICSGCRDGADFELPFAMAFQPIVDIETGWAFAYESLVRGVDGAGAFQILSNVTETNRYSFDQACRVKAIETAMAAGLMQSDAKLSINFLPNAVYSPLACIQLTLATARSVGLPIDRLIFEFTENELMGSPDHVLSIIDTYKKIGFTVAIDDFGARHSGLDMFARFCPDEIKLDMKLVRGIDEDRRRQAIVRALVRMCEELDTVVIAEGIESAGEALALRDLGVWYHQGYWYARPQIGVLPAISSKCFPANRGHPHRAEHQLQCLAPIFGRAGKSGGITRRSRSSYTEFIGDMHQPLHLPDHHDENRQCVSMTYSYSDGAKMRSNTVKLQRCHCAASGHPTTFQ